MRVASLIQGGITTDRIVENCGLNGAEYLVVFLDPDMWSSPNVLQWDSGRAAGGGAFTLAIDIQSGILRGVVSIINRARFERPSLTFDGRSINAVPVFDTELWKDGATHIKSDWRPICCWTEDGRFAIEATHGVGRQVTECVISPQLSLILGEDYEVLGLIFGALSVTDRIVLEQAEEGYIESHTLGTLQELIAG